jgi:Undecaprenyl-phosphate glucose phosphotransferase
VLKQRHQFFVLLLGIADAVVVAAACVLAWAVRRDAIDGTWPAASGLQSLRTLLQETLLIFAVPVAVSSLRVFGLYMPFRDRRLLAESRQVLKATLATLVSLIVLMWALGPSIVGGFDPSRTAAWGSVALDAGRVQLLALAVIMPAALVVSRMCFRVALRAARKRGRNLRHVAVIGTGRLGRIACRTLDRNSWTGINVAYFIHHHDHVTPTDMVVGRPVLGGISQLEQILQLRPPDAIYLALPNTRASMMPELLRRLERYPIDVRIIPDVSPKYTPMAMTVSELEGMPILSVRESPMNGVAGIAKRGLDVAGAVAGILIFGLPMIGIAMAIKFTSPGPVVFRQRRVSVGGEEFEILKFRTMQHVQDENTPATWTARGDARVTKIGSFLRRTSLDELPQLFNVFLGQMSLVGPRPERPELIARFKDDWRGYVLRQHVKAGMTGWAQVNGLRGDTSLRKRLQLDLFYIRNWSLGFDIKILWLTLFRGFAHPNAH